MALSEREQKEYEVLKGIQAGHLTDEEGDEMLALYDLEYSDSGVPFSGATRQEMHPDVSLKDRFVAKNFARDTDKQVEYLKQQYPQMDIDLSRNGQIRMKNKQDSHWRVLDPDTGFFSKDFLSDVGDIGYDLYAAGSEGLATVGGALGGGFFTGGAGAIPGAMVAGGASTAANEAMRQKLGSYLGVPQEVNMDDVKESGMIGTAAPLLFGAGKAKGALSYAAKGAGKIANKLNPLPGIGEKVSGIPRDILKNYYDDSVRETVKRLEREGVSEYTGKVFDKLKNYVETSKEKAGEDLVKEIDNLGRPINIRPAKASFTNKVGGLLKQDHITDADQKAIDAIEKQYNLYYGMANTKPVMNTTTLITESSPEFLPNRVSAKKAWDLQKKLKQSADFEKTDLTPADLAKKESSRDSYFKINKAFDRASNNTIGKAKDRYKQAIVDEQELLPKFEGKTRLDSIQKTFNQMSSLDKQGRRALQERLNKLTDEGLVDLVDDAKTLSTYRYLGKPQDLPVSSGGTTSTTRSVPMAVGGASLGSLIGYNAGGGYAGATLGGAAGAILGNTIGSPKMMTRYIEAMRAAGRARELVTPKDMSPYLPYITGGAIEMYDQK